MVRENLRLDLIQYFLYLINLFSKTIWKIAFLACSLSLKHEYKFCQIQRHLWLENDPVPSEDPPPLAVAKSKKRNQFCPVNSTHLQPLGRLQLRPSHIHIITKLLHLQILIQIFHFVYIYHQSSDSINNKPWKWIYNVESDRENGNVFINCWRIAPVNNSYLVVSLTVGLKLSSVATVRWE